MLFGGYNLLNIKTFKTGKWSENCYIIHSISNSGLIIDPGANHDEINFYITQKKIHALAIINTHAHYDHIGAVSKLKEILNIPFYLHNKDMRLLKSANLFRALFDSKKTIKIPIVDNHFDQNEKNLIFNDIFVEIIETPGHTKGSVCFLIENNLFTGDTIMRNSVGRIDLPGSSKKDLYNSLKKLLKLSPETIILPGHGKRTILKKESEFLLNYLNKNVLD